MPWFILITAIIAGIFISFVVVRKRLAKQSAMEGETEDKPIEARLQQDADEVAAIPQLLEPKSLPQEPIPHGIYAYEPSVLPEATLSPQENSQVERVSAVKEMPQAQPAPLPTAPNAGEAIPAAPRNKAEAPAAGQQAVSNVVEEADKPLLMTRDERIAILAKDRDAKGRLTPEAQLAIVREGGYEKGVLVDGTEMAALWGILHFIMKNPGKNGKAVHSQVPLGAIIRHTNYTSYTAISGKRVDFLIIDKTTAEPVAVVEVLGPGHYGTTPEKEKEVRHTDEIKRIVFDETGIAFIIVDVQEKYGFGWEKKVREKTLEALYAYFGPGE